MSAAANAPVDPDNLLDDEKPETDQPAGDPPAADPPAEKDWEAEFKAQQKINRDLERRSKARLRELETELATAKAPKPAEDEKPDVEQIREQIRKETRAEAVRESALDKLEAKAARKFQNPEDARAFLASHVDDYIAADGKVDVQAINDALDDLLTERPYLGVTQGDTKRFQGTGDGGPKGTAGKPQLTEADVKRLSKEGKHAEIELARTEGRLNTLLGIT